MIYHICLIDDFNSFDNKDYYQAASLNTEGFIHCSTKNQILATLLRYYGNEEHIYLLSINETLLTAELKYEFATSVNEEFPHIFGVINKTAIEEIITINVKNAAAEITEKIK